jgi:hypothetical protein
MKLTLIQHIQIFLLGSVKIGEITRPGWSGSLPLYAFRCPEHGIVSNRPQGYGEYLRCPVCEGGSPP